MIHPLGSDLVAAIERHAGTTTRLELVAIFSQLLANLLHNCRDPAEATLARTIILDALKTDQSRFDARAAR